MSSHSSGRGKPYGFLYKTSHCLSVLEYDLAYNKHFSGENALVEKAPLLLPQKRTTTAKKVQWRTYNIEIQLCYLLQVLKTLEKE